MPRIPLLWTNRRTYAAPIRFDDTEYKLQIGTLASDVWLECESDENSTLACRSACDGVVTAESGQFCVLPQLNVTMEWPEASLAFKDFPITIEESSSMLDAYAAIASAAYLKMQSDISLHFPLGAKTDGVLGLGRGRAAVERNFYTAVAVENQPHTAAVNSFLLYLRDESKEEAQNKSFLMINDEDTTFLATEGFPTALSLPLWTPDIRDSQDPSSNVSWTVEVEAVSFDTETTFIPHGYRGKNAETSSVGLLSANSRGIEVPSEVFDYFRTNFLPFNVCFYDPDREPPLYYACEPSVLDQLPRIGIYIGHNVFYLDPADYTHPSMINSEQIVVEVTQSIFQDDVWVLGSTFLRKFPSHFQQKESLVTLYCDGSTTCHPLAVDAKLELVRIDPPIDTGSHTASSASAAGDDVVIDVNVNKPSSGYSTVALSFLAVCVVGIGLVLLVWYIVKRRRDAAHAREQAARQDYYDHLRRNDVPTVHSERDLAEQLRAQETAFTTYRTERDVFQGITPPTSYRNPQRLGS